MRLFWHFTLAFSSIDVEAVHEGCQWPSAGLYATVVAYRMVNYHVYSSHSWVVEEYDLGFFCGLHYIRYVLWWCIDEIRTTYLGLFLLGT